jgi:hypothetical protein
MELFQQFQRDTEKALEEGLVARLSWFDMADFLGLVEERPDELHSDVFDVLMTMSDFEEFADLMASFKDEQEGTGIMQGAMSLTVTSLPALGGELQVDTTTDPAHK